MPLMMRKNVFFFLLVLARFSAPKREAFAVVVQKWPLKLHSNSSVSLEAGENNTILFDSDVTTIHNKLTLHVDDVFDFSSEFEPAAKALALDELEGDFFEAFPKVAPISLCGGFACAHLDDKSVKCWGNNWDGQLGVGDTNHRGDGPGEMGDNLPAVDLGTGRTATAISCDYSTACALLDDKSVKCWGYNWNGQLGLGDTYSRGGALLEMGDNLPAVDLGTGRTATAIFSGGEYRCALLDNKSVKCWGSNWSGQLGVGDTNHRGDGPNEMGDNLPAVDLGTGRTATAISMGDGYTCALLDDNSVKCWGYNYYGQLGVGDTNNRGDGPNEMGDNLPAVDLGSNHVRTYFNEDV